MSTNTTGQSSTGSRPANPDSDADRSANTDDSTAETHRSTDPGVERPPEPVDAPVPIDAIHEMLKNQRRRYVLHYLDVTEGPVPLGDLAEQIAAWENDKEPRLVTSTERKRVYVGLYQCHLSQLADCGAVSYDQPRGIVEPGEHFQVFKRYLPTPQSSRQSKCCRLLHYLLSRSRSLIQQ